ncbi:MAG: hypothetical protein K0Q74_851 [Gammaproteobacteria bacterium]|jgi:hypothetical protein|nr:hypothetical protein [Gammaproteobacteria bacterium]
MIKFIHLLISVTFLGFQIAGYYYVVASLKQSSPSLVLYTLKNTLLIDIASFIFIVGIFTSCAFLVMQSTDFSFTIPWVAAACFSLSLVTLLWALNVTLRWINFMRLKKSNNFKVKYVKGLHITYCSIIVLLILVVRDAVMKSTPFI